MGAGMARYARLHAANEGKFSVDTFASFRASVREFAEGELRPRVQERDEKGKLDPALI